MKLLIMIEDEGLVTKAGTDISPEELNVAPEEFARTVILPLWATVRDEVKA